VVRPTKEAHLMEEIGSGNTHAREQLGSLGRLVGGKEEIGETGGSIRKASL